MIGAADVENGMSLWNEFVLVQAGMIDGVDDGCRCMIWL